MTRFLQFIPAFLGPVDAIQPLQLFLKRRFEVGKLQRHHHLLGAGKAKAAILLCVQDRPFVNAPIAQGGQTLCYVLKEGALRPTSHKAGTRLLWVVRAHAHNAVAMIIKDTADPHLLLGHAVKPQGNERHSDNRPVSPGLACTQKQHKI